MPVTVCQNKEEDQETLEQTLGHLPEEMQSLVTFAPTHIQLAGTAAL